MQLNDFENKQFSKGFKGYNVQEVDSYMSHLLDFCHTQNERLKMLERKVAAYEKQEQYIRTTLITAEETAEAIKMKAYENAKSIQALAEKKAVELIKKTEKETEAYRNSVDKSLFYYERELRRVIDRFYALAREHMETLERELSEDIRSTIFSLDREVSAIPKLKLVSNNGKAEESPNRTAQKLKERETAALLGRILKQDIINPDGCIMAKKDSVITPEMINSLIGKGLYGELIVAAEK